MQQSHATSSSGTARWRIIGGLTQRFPKLRIRVILDAALLQTLDVILPFHRSADGVLRRCACARPGQPRRGAGRDDRASWKLGLRQDDAAALDCRLRDPRVRGDSRRRQGHHPAAARSARDRDDVPVVRALAAHERGRQHRLWLAHARLEKGRDRDEGCRHAEASAARRLRSAAGDAALRWAASASRPRACARRRSAFAAARRADVESRLQGPAGAPPRAARFAKAHRHHRGLRHARPRGGADACRPHRGHRRRPHRPDRRA